MLGMGNRRLAYLGPQGTFTHQAAIEAARLLSPAMGGDEPRLTAEADVPAILRAVESGEAWGVIAWENNVEGYVVPNLDALIDARDIVGFARVGVDISFDAFTKPGDDQDDSSSCPPTRDTVVSSHLAHDAASPCYPAPNAVPSCHPERSVAESKDPSFHCHECQSPVIDTPCQQEPRAGARVSAHPHGLAQCKRFIAEHGLIPEPSTSNAAACRDLRPGDVALGPSICGQLYDLNTLASGVQDFAGARTEFLVLAPRDEAAALLSEARAENIDEYETIVTFIPLSTGPGVLANLLDVLRDAGLNMTSFISRPIKGHAGTYSFIATLDAAPWQPRFRAMLTEVAEHGDWVKTLAVYPRRERPNPPVDAWMLPEGGVHLDAASIGDGWQDEPTVRRELMW